jgi:hypothetical protein
MHPSIASNAFCSHSDKLFVVRIVRPITDKQRRIELSYVALQEVVQDKQAIAAGVSTHFKICSAQSD